MAFPLPVMLLSNRMRLLCLPAITCFLLVSWTIQNWESAKLEAESVLLFDFKEHHQPFVQHHENIRAAASNNSCSQLRTCPHGHVNKIFVAATNRAGLNDRVSIFKAVVNLAGYLCATVEVRDPNHFLHPTHNNGESLDARMTWEDEFVSFHFFGDNTLAMKTVQDLDSNYDHHLRSVEDSHFLEHFRQAQAMYENATTFLWEWKPDNYFKAINTIGDYLVTLPQNDTTLPALLKVPGCQYAYMQSPQDIIALAESIWMDVVKEMGANVIAGYFHIRRGDSIDDCDTSLPRMDRFLSCSMNGTESLGPIALLFSSDETSTIYRSDIETLVNAKSDSVRFFDLDTLCYLRLQNEIRLSRAPPWRLNNYYLFALINIIVNSKAQFRLEQRRKFSCYNCADVRAQIKKSASL